MIPTTLNSRLLGRLVLLTVPGPAVLLLAGGDSRWTMGWVFAVFGFAFTVTSRLALFRRNPDLVVERVEAMSRPNVEPWDRVLVPLLDTILPLAAVLIAGLDHRFRWSPGFPACVQAAAYLPMTAGGALAQWAATENAFFSAVVRIQTDRGQKVVSTGPYRFIRHPGYAGGMIFHLFLPFALGSLWTLLPVLATLALTVVRTSLEDKTLARKLPGYAEYSKKTTRRLFPGLW